MKKIIAALAIAAAAVPFTAAQAATISFADSKALATTNWTDVLSFGKFDTSLGTLTSIKFDLSGLIEGVGSAESLDGSPSKVTLSLGSVLSLTRPDNSALVVTKPVFTQAFNFAAFDGAINFSGASGATTGSVTATGAEFFVSTDANDFALFSALGGGVINLGLSGVGSASGTGAGNLLTLFNTAAAANAMVTYTYTPTADVPEPATLATIIAGLGLMGAARRRTAKKA